jgi:hypothetical protein
MAATTRHPAVAGTAAAPSSLHPAPVAPPGATARTTTTAAVAPGANTSGQRKYKYTGGFDFTKISSGMREKFKHVGRFDERSLPNMQALLGLIEADTAMNDIRWIAYMLATALWETSHIEVIKVPVVDAKGVSKTDKVGNVITRTKKIWTNMAPAPETGSGAGRGYFLPVKIATLPSGEMQVTEQDGDQWTINANGVEKAVTGTRAAPRKVADLGASPGTKTSDIYKKALGDEKKFYGRGYVQLTWWSNYAKAGVELNKGVGFFLNDPEQAMEASYAYQLMSIGMRTGAGFANGLTFEDYFSGNDRDYAGARTMVNKKDVDSIQPVAEIARLFEDVLWDARKT